MIVPFQGEAEWMLALRDLPTWQPPPKHTLVVSPHPDDETLGTGGLIAALCNNGTQVDIMAVTDGEAAYGDAATEARSLATLRQREQTNAAARLGVDVEHIHRLRLPDSALASHQAKLEAALLDCITPKTHVIAPWLHDFHPDHEVCGRAAEAASKRKGSQLTYYFFWTWHRGNTSTLAGLSLHRLPLSHEAQQAKRGALMCHRSQLEHASGSPILPEPFLYPARWPFEVFLPS